MTKPYNMRREKCCVTKPYDKMKEEWHVTKPYVTILEIKKKNRLKKQKKLWSPVYVICYCYRKPRLR